MAAADWKAQEDSFTLSSPRSYTPFVEKSNASGKTCETNKWRSSVLCSWRLEDEGEHYGKPDHEFLLASTTNQLITRFGQSTTKQVRLIERSELDMAWAVNTLGLFMAPQVKHRLDAADRRQCR